MYKHSWIDRGRPSRTCFGIPWPGGLAWPARLAKWVPFRGINYDATERNGAATTTTSQGWDDGTAPLLYSLDGVMDVGGVVVALFQVVP